MNLSPLRRILPAGIAGSAVIATPACAAVCPKGIGNCPYPGRCMLFSDADGDRLCDFNLTDSGTTAPDVTVSAGDGGSSVAGTIPDAASSVPADPGLAGSTDFLFMSPLLLWAVLFLVINTGLLWFIHSGRTGLPRELNIGTIALSSLFSLAISGIAVFLMTCDLSLGSTGAVVYMLAGTVLATVVWSRGLMTKKTALALLGLTTAFGFVFAAPIMPVYFYGLAAALTDIRTIAPGMAAIVILILLTFVTGRTFCGHICPVGTIQELASRLPGKKYLIQNRTAPQAIRLVVLAGVITGIFYSVNLPAYTGVEAFFSFALTTGFLVFAAILIASVFVYRPFCRFLCPFGAVFAAGTAVGKTCIARTDACIGCRKCEKVCPTGEAGPHERKPECYLCGRCIDVCPVEGALAFTDPVSRDIRK
ncbi:4Fe-4S binding protein [Methanogenium organophilum]|uniref:4Fe-4S binding protein n=1 Tax=Methanogenium organophilum TaxID=2199 RepID=A0A9X9S672_METOG|nr:4Fe-4S binding protein [Methanogenium organophilum]WAI02158.1 4Fe-4S binding protein [Methanogenium organophilum]